MIKIALKGDKEIRAMINSLTAVTSESMSKAIALTAARVEADAKDRCPKDTGFTADSIDTEMIYEKDSITAKVGATKEAFWAKYLEFGTGIYAVGGNGRKTPWVFYYEKIKQFVTTHGMKPRPFLFPALRANKAFARQILKAAVTEGWGKVRRK